MPAKKYYSGKIPFKDFPECTYQGKVVSPASSRQLDYASYYEKDVVWKDNVRFFARLRINGFSRGRSAANFLGVLTGVEVSGNPEMSAFLEGKEVNLFMIDMMDIVTNCNLYCGKTDSSHVFTFCKRGQSYGITRVV